MIMAAKVESPITNKTSTEKKVAAAKVTAGAVTAADVKKAIAAPKVEAPKRGPKKAAVPAAEAVSPLDGAEVKKEEAPKKRGRKPGVKKEAAKKETAKKTEVKKETEKKAPAKKVEEKFVIQFAGRECTKEAIVDRIQAIWTNDFGKNASEMKKVAFYVKPEEAAVYYVINDDITGRFDI